MNKSFIFGGDTGMTYEELVRERAIADQLAQTASGSAQNIQQGASQLGAAIGFRIRDARARKGLEAGRNAFNDQFNSFLGGGSPPLALPGGSASASPARPPSPAPSSAAPNRPQSAIGRLLSARGAGVAADVQRPSDLPRQNEAGITPQQAAADTQPNRPRPQPVQQVPTAAQQGAPIQPQGFAPQGANTQPVPNDFPGQPSPGVEVASLDPNAGFRQAAGENSARSNLLAQISTDTRAVNRPSSGITNISLDFNAAPKGDGRGTEVIIPDDASPEIRQAAEEYNNRIVAFARANGIPDYPNRGVKTRSQNGRGVSHTVHTEPFFNNDIEFQNIVKNNMDEFAAITGSTFGQLESARIIPPHGVGRDRGAASSVFGNETAFGKQVVASLMGGASGSAPQRPAPQGAVPQRPAAQGAGGSPQRPAPQRVAQAQGLAGVDPRLLQMAQNPYASPQQKQIISTMIQQQIAQNAPPSRSDILNERKFDFERQRFEAEQAAAAARSNREFDLDRQRFEAEQAQRAAEANEPINVNGTLVDPNTFEPVFEKAPEPTRLLQEYDRHVELAKSRGEQPLSLVDYQTRIKQAGANQTNVSVGTEPNDGALRKKLNEKTAELWSTYQEQGATSAALNGDLDVLDELIQLAPQGAITGRLASAFPGISSAGDAFNSIVKRVAPTMRAPGSGSTSDIEYDGMLQSLPALRNRPEANAMIAQILRAKSTINLERSRIVDQYANNEISASDARNAISELDRRSIITPDMRRALSGLGAKFDESEPESQEQGGWTTHNGVRIRKKQ